MATKIFAGLVCQFEEKCDVLPGSTGSRILDVLSTAVNMVAVPADLRRGEVLSELDYNLVSIAMATPTTSHSRRRFDRTARIGGQLAKAAMCMLVGESPDCHLKRAQLELNK